MEIIETINSAVNNIIWGPYMLCLLLGTGIFFSIKLRFFQITHFKFWWKETAMSFFKSNNTGTGSKGKISPFQAMSTALAGSIGTGNIVGVANAVALGGAGAVFWMWIASVFGMATIYAENVLGIKYRTKRNGKYVGGPMYYIEKGLHCKPLAVIFAVLCTLAALGMGNMTQANSAAGAAQNCFGIPPWVSGAVLTAAVGLIIFGGIDRIAKLTEKLIPLISVVFTSMVMIVILINFQKIPAAFENMFVEAFDLKCVSGGLMGYGMSRALKYGISRGVFSNEAGLGSSPIVHSAADTDSAYRQGMWGMFQVFIDTTVLCTLMALCILTTNSEQSGLDGIELSIYTFESALGSIGGIFLSLSILIFAFATLVSWCYYGEKSLEYLSGDRYIRIYRIIYSLVTFVGCTMHLSLVWEISDTLNGLMAIPNLIAIVLLSGKIKYSDVIQYKNTLRNPKRV